MRIDIQPEEVLIKRAVKATFQIFYDGGFFASYATADEIFTVFTH